MSDKEQKKEKKTRVKSIPVEEVRDHDEVKNGVFKLKKQPKVALDALINATRPLTQKAIENLKNVKNKINQGQQAVADIAHELPEHLKEQLGQAALNLVPLKKSPYEFKLQRLSSVCLQEGKEKVSEQLKAFEQQFEYPLGDKTFKIVHGAGDGCYFDFFKALGDTDGYLIYAKGEGPVVLSDWQLMGVIMVVNRKDLGWYVCDYKLAPAIRGLGVDRLLVSKGLVDFGVSGLKGFSVNMSAPAGNRLFEVIRPKLWFAPIKAEAMHLWHWHQVGPPKMSQEGMWMNISHFKTICVQGTEQVILHWVAKSHPLFDHFLALHREAKKGIKKHYFYLDADRNQCFETGSMQVISLMQTFVSFWQMQELSSIEI